MPACIVWLYYASSSYVVVFGQFFLLSVWSPWKKKYPVSFLTLGNFQGPGELQIVQVYLTCLHWTHPPSTYIRMLKLLLRMLKPLYSKLLAQNWIIEGNKRYHLKFVSSKKLNFKEWRPLRRGMAMDDIAMVRRVCAL